MLGITVLYFLQHNKEHPVYSIPFLILLLSSFLSSNFSTSFSLYIYMYRSTMVKREPRYTHCHPTRNIVPRLYYFLHLRFLLPSLTVPMPVVDPVLLLLLRHSLPKKLTKWKKNMIRNGVLKLLQCR